MSKPLTGKNNENFDQGAHSDLWLALISDMLDDTLPAAARTSLEGHLAGCADCRADLEGMRQTVQLLHRLPQVPAPRSFTLTPAQARRLRPAPFYRFSQVAAAIAAAFLVFLFALELAGAFNTPVAIEQTAQVAPSPTIVLPEVGTLAPSDPSKAGAIQASGGATITPQAANPTATPVKSPPVPAAQEGPGTTIRGIQVGLLLLALMFAAFALALRPRAPGRSKSF